MRSAIHRYWDESYNVALAEDLRSLGGARLSGHVQCFTTAGDCDTTLFRLKLVQSTGLIYDYFIFGSLNEPVIQRARQQTWNELQQNVPQVIVMGRGSFPDATDNTYNKIEGWPALSAFLNTNYSVPAERAFSPAECGIRGYRLYVLNPHAAARRSPVNIGLGTPSALATTPAVDETQTTGIFPEFEPAAERVKTFSSVGLWTLAYKRTLQASL